MLRIQNSGAKSWGPAPRHPRQAPRHQARRRRHRQPLRRPRDRARNRAIARNGGDPRRPRVPSFADAAAAAFDQVRTAAVDDVCVPWRRPASTPRRRPSAPTSRPCCAGPPCASIARTTTRSLWCSPSCRNAPRRSGTTRRCTTPKSARTCRKLRSSSRVAATARTQECRGVSETTRTLSTLGARRQRTTSSSLSALLISQLRKAATKRRPTLAQQARTVDAEHMRPVLDELQPRKGPAFPGNPRVVACSPRTAPTGQSELTSGPQGCTPQPPRSDVSAWATGVGFRVP